MLACTICRNSGRPALYQDASGWHGCVRIHDRLHVRVHDHGTQNSALLALEEWARRRFDEWDVVDVLVKEDAQLRMF
jgi:hypothetical protein